MKFPCLKSFTTDLHRPWDIANKASDMLMLRLDRELCSCAGNMTKFQTGDISSAIFLVREVSTVPVSSRYATVDLATLEKAAVELSDEFSRYKLLRDFTDGELPWKFMHPAIALTLGLRSVDGELRQVSQLHPIGWPGLHQGMIPDFSDTDNLQVSASIPFTTYVFLCV